MESDLALLLARIQFAFVVAFHILFPAFTIGLASYLAVLEGLWLKTREARYRELYLFWVRVFALSFAMGVVSGIVMSYQFGTNWSRFSDMTAPVLGPLFAYEVLTAFFLEAGFLGIMLFGWRRVGDKLHFVATLMVAIGTLISSFWILSANSWMHTPTSFYIEGAQYYPEDWLEVIFNPSFPYRLVHMVLAAYLTTAFAVGAAAAWHLLKGRTTPAVRTMFSNAMWMAALVAPLQLVAGDLHGLNTLEHQPAKIAAMEGHFESRAGAPLVLFGVPDEEAGKMRYAVEIPKLGSLILTHEWDGEVAGLDAFAPEDRPPVALPFYAFRLMVGIGLLMIAVGLLSLYLRWRGRLYDARLFHRACLFMGPLGFIAVIAGWTTTEVGRQPWVVYGVLRTADAASPVNASTIGFSLAAYVVVYVIVFGLGIYYLLRLMAKEPSVARPMLEREPATVSQHDIPVDDGETNDGGAQR